MKQIQKTLILFGILFSTTLQAQPLNSIRGIITDGASGQVLPYATIVVLNTNPPKGITTDSLGNFRLDNLSVGRYDIQASYVGYESTVFREVMVGSGREAFLEIPLKESIHELGEIVVRPKTNKEEPLNKMAVAGARMLSVEEASRYAGGFDDPARLVTAFAGVAGNVSSNGIAIRGNSPQSLQWKLEGVEIPNPSHFADIGGVGGGILTAMSSQVLGNSDFFTGAFPAEYGNALSGVFDMWLRNGNNQNYENAVQVGTLGIDVSSEGPFKKGGKSSYLFNYRYATMALAADVFPDLMGEAGGMKYQDLSFKLNFPTRSAGTFSVWGIGLIDKFANKALEDTLLWTHTNDKFDSTAKQYMGAGGVGHKYFFNSTTFLKTTLATTYSNNHLWVDANDTQKNPQRVTEMQGSNWNIVLNSYLNKKFNAKHTNKSGITFTQLFYDLDYNMNPDLPLVDGPMVNFSNSIGSSTLLSAFSNSSINLSNRLTASVGFNAQMFLLNNHWTIEPRLGLKWRAAPQHSLSIAYGMHSRLEKLDYYFITTPQTGNELVNKNLDFAKAQHLTFAYDWSISDNLHFKVEPYFQYLYDIPVEKNSSFSIINHSDWYLKEALVNGGEGLNYGIDFTLERYLANGYYYLLTASLFESKYCGGDDVWRDTRLNRNFLINALGGKEWLMGKQKQNVFSLNLRFSYQGGDRYTPVDAIASAMKEDAVLDETLAFSKQFDPAFISNFTISYKMNKKRISHEFAFKIINATGYKEFISQEYNYQTKLVDVMRESTIVPNIYYKIEF